jgi:hypothetical protein
LIIRRRLIVPLAVALVVTARAGLAFAQGASPAPLPDQTVQVGPSDDCRKGFMALREEAETRGQLIQAASGRHAPPDEACKLIGNFVQAEVKMIKYVESHATTCGISPQISDQMKTRHKNTETMQTKVCALAQQVLQRGPSGPTGDFWTLPEKQL